MSKRRHGSRKPADCKPKDSAGDCGEKARTCVPADNRGVCVLRAETLKSIEPYRRCGACFHGQGGHGLVYSTKGRTRYLKCLRRVNREGVIIDEGCGLNWSHKFSPAVVMPPVEFRDVDLSTRG